MEFLEGCCCYDEEDDELCLGAQQYCDQYNALPEGPAHGASTGMFRRRKQRSDAGVPRGARKADSRPRQQRRLNSAENETEEELLEYMADADLEAPCSTVTSHQQEAQRLNSMIAELEVMAQAWEEATKAVEAELREFSKDHESTWKARRAEIEQKWQQLRAEAGLMLLRQQAGPRADDTCQECGALDPTIRYHNSESCLLAPQLASLVMCNVTANPSLGGMLLYTCVFTERCLFLQVQRLQALCWALAPVQQL